MSTQQDYRVTAVIDGIDFGAFLTFTGGEVTAEPQVKRGPDNKFRQHRVRPSNPSDVTISRDYLDKDDYERVRKLMQRVGIASATITRQLDDIDGTTSSQTTFTGLLMSVTPGDVDKGGTEVSGFELGFQIVAVA